MINIDSYLDAFMATNWKTLSLVFAVLIGLAKESPWTWDERVLNVIIAPFRAIFDRFGVEEKRDNSS